MLKIAALVADQVFLQETLENRDITIRHNCIQELLIRLVATEIRCPVSQLLLLEELVGMNPVPEVKWLLQLVPLITTD